MDTETTETVADVIDETTDAADVADVERPEGEQTQEDPAAGLKKALAAERKARKDAERKFRDLSVEHEAAGKPADEQELDRVRREATTEATGKANTRIIRAEVKAAAVGKVKNPALALKLIDTSGIDVDDDGEVDSDALQAAIADLLTEYPELAADAARFQGGADQGAKGKTAKPSQVTQQELDSMSSAEVNTARREGRLKTLLGN